MSYKTSINVICKAQTPPPQITTTKRTHKNRNLDFFFFQVLSLLRSLFTLFSLLAFNILHIWLPLYQTKYLKKTYLIASLFLAQCCLLLTDKWGQTVPWQTDCNDIQQKEISQDRWPCNIRSTIIQSHDYAHEQIHHPHTPTSPQKSDQDRWKSCENSLPTKLWVKILFWRPSLFNNETYFAPNIQ